MFGSLILAESISIQVVSSAFDDLAVTTVFLATARMFAGRKSTLFEAEKKLSG